MLLMCNSFINAYMPLLLQDYLTQLSKLKASTCSYEVRTDGSFISLLEILNVVITTC